MPELPEPRRVTPRVSDLLNRGQGLMGGQYLLFVAMAFIAFFLGQLTPFGILTGPLFCGVYFACSRRERGGEAELADVFKGFERFLDAFLASLIILGVSLAAMIPLGIAIAVGIIGGAAAAGGDSDAAAAMFWIAMPIILLALLAIQVVLGAAHLFVYPLIMDRDIKGWEAVLLSYRAFWKSPFSLLWVSLVFALLGLIGLLCCYVGLFFVLPFVLAGSWCLYRDVFPPPPEPVVQEAEYVDPLGS